MMSNEGVLRRVFAAINAGDWPAVVEGTNPDVRVSNPIPDVGQTSHPHFTATYYGHGELTKMLAGLAEGFEGFQFELRWVEEVGDDGLLFEVLALIGPRSRRSAQLGWCLARFRDGLIVSTSTFGTEASAREAIAAGA